MIRKAFFYCLGVFAVAGLALVGCDKTETEEVYAPVVTVSTATISASLEGGNYSFTYEVKNTAEDGTVECYASTGWISNIDCSTFGVVTFTVNGNPNGDPRTGRVTLTYSTSYASASGEVTVAQNASDVPSIRVQPTAVAAAISGGTYSFTYSVTNPVSDGMIVCDADVDWIDNFDTTTSGIVSFSVAENTATYMRTGVITASYAYSGGEVYETVTVVQDHEGSSDESGGDVSGVVGTYACKGISYNFNVSSYYEDEGMENEWTMAIYDGGGSTVILSGLVPTSYGFYEGQYGESTEAYLAEGTYQSNGDIVIYPQYTGWYVTPYADYGDTTKYNICWLLSAYDYDETYSSYAFYYFTTYSYPCTLVYDSTTNSWTSDYGMWLAATPDYGYGLDGKFIFYDVIGDGMTMTKTADKTSVETPASVKSAPEMTPHSAQGVARLCKEN